MGTNHRKSIFRIEFFAHFGRVVYTESIMYCDKSYEYVVNSLVPHKVSTDFKNLSIHHIKVQEIPLEEDMFIDEFLREATLLHDGVIWVEKNYSTIKCAKEFPGREAYDIHFKEGEMVSYVDDGQIKEGRVCMLPPKKGEFEIGYLDDSDDSYVILEGDGPVDREYLDAHPNEYMERHVPVSVSNVFAIDYGDYKDEEEKEYVN